MQRVANQEVSSPPLIVYVTGTSFQFLLLLIAGVMDYITFVCLNNRSFTDWSAFCSVVPCLMCLLICVVNDFVIYLSLQ
jgi:hypothetical protein